MKLTKWSPDFQKQIVACMARLPGFAARFTGVLLPQYLESPGLSRVLEYVGDYYREYGKLPSRATLSEIVGDDNRDVVKALFKRDISDVDIVADLVADFCQLQAVKLAIDESTDEIVAGKLDNIVDRMDKALRVGQDLTNLGTYIKGADSSDLNARAELYRSGEAMMVGRIPTGFQHLDECLDGGLCPGELGVFAALPKRGKSQILANIAVNAVCRGLRVMFYSLEMSDKKVLARIDRRLTRTPTSLVRATPELFADKLTQTVGRLVTGDCLVKSYPTRTAKASTIRSHLSRVIGEGFLPQIVIVDYGDIMAPERRIGEPRHEIAGQFEDLRKLAGEFNVVVWTATQLNRAAMNKVNPDIDHLAEAFEKVHICDAMILWVRTDEEEVEDKDGMSRGRFTLGALRDARHHRTIPCEVNFDYSYIDTVCIEEVQIGEKKVKGESAVANQRAALAQKRDKEKVTGKRPRSTK